VIIMASEKDWASVSGPLATKKYWYPNMLVISRNNLRISNCVAQLSNCWPMLGASCFLLNLRSHMHTSRKEFCCRYQPQYTWARSVLSYKISKLQPHLSNP